MKRLALPAAAFAAAALTVATAASSAPKVICVGGAGCYPTLNAALAVANDGDTVRLNPGTFAGGVTITHSITLQGAGASLSVIKGGGPVVTIGVDRAATEPTVSITGVTITGGLSRTASECGPDLDECVTRYYPATALGGGIEIPPAAGLATGATVTISDSVVTNNVAAPTMTVPSETHLCLGVPCNYAHAAGGGIDDWGMLTLIRTTVSNNQAGGAYNSSADGGGIVVRPGDSLTLRNSLVSGNRAVGTPPDARFAGGGGIFDADGTLTVTGSAITGNTASLTSSYPSSVEQQANFGGVAITGDNGTAIFDFSRIDGNTVDAENTNGEPAAFDAGICACGGGPLTLRNTSVSNNRVIANVADTTDPGPGGGALEIDGAGTVENAVISNNTATIHALGGVAGVVGALNLFGQPDQPILVANSLISGNTYRAVDDTGTATLQGAGVLVDGIADLRNDIIVLNRGSVSAPSGWAQGGGIWEGVLFNDPPITLSLEHTHVSGNSLTGSTGLPLLGGGIYAVGFPPTLTGSVVAHNAPDNCEGLGC